MAAGGYDLYTTSWSPEGRVFQVEYAAKCADNSTTSIGMCCNGGVVLARAVPRLTKTQRFPSSTYQVIQAVDEHILFTFSGHKPDGLHILARAREEAANYRSTFGVTIKLEVLVNRLGLYISQFTEYWSLRPVGCVIILASADALYTLDPAAESIGYFGCAIGKGRTQAKTELEKLDRNAMSIEETLLELTKILYRTHDENQDKPIEIQLGFVSDGQVQVVDYDQSSAIARQAQADIEEEEEEEDDEEEDEEDDEDVQMD